MNRNPLCPLRDLKILRLISKYMPNMNGTGPRGEGAMTGRGLGKCEGERPAGWFRGRGMRNWFGRDRRGLGLRRRANGPEDKA